MALDNVISPTTPEKPAAPSQVPCRRKNGTTGAAGEWSVVGRGRVPGIVFIGWFPERFSHVQEPRLVAGVSDLLRQPHAFRGISTVIDGGKKRQPSLPDTQREKYSPGPLAPRNSPSQNC